MNLIEQLAGYGECERLRKVPAASRFRIRGIEFTREELERAMLEHRRAHNIFEVGDKIVYLSNIAPEHNDIYDIWKVNLIGCLVVLGDMDYRAMYDQIRHATDAEISAGHRL